MPFAEWEINNAIDAFHKHLDGYIEQVLESRCWSEHGSDIERFLVEYREENPELREASDRRVLREWLPNRLAFIARTLPADIARVEREGRLKAERALVIEAESAEPWRESLGAHPDLGRYWSIGEFVEPHGVDPSAFRSPVEVQVSAWIDPESVDWTETLRSRIDWENGDDENEITLRPGARVELITVYGFDERLESTLSP